MAKRNREEMMQEIRKKKKTKKKGEKRQGNKRITEGGRWRERRGIKSNYDAN